MRDYYKMILFVLVMGVLTSVFLGGMDLLTKDKILENQDAELKSVILSANDVEYNFSNIHDIFEEAVVEEEHDGIAFYIDNKTGTISYIFEGSGLWGDIIGVVTLESDFETIHKVAILQQEETPGLGGRIVEEQFLALFVGKKMVPSIQITKNATDSPNEVKAISGATGTSNRLQGILNTSYADALAAWEARNN